MMEEKKIVVCAECLMACCWQGEFMCEDAQYADVVEKSIEELKELNLESPHYWE
jgi:hypothetical protein